MEYRYKTFISPRQFKLISSARKILFTIFGDMKGVVHMEKGQIVNSEQYVSTQRVLKTRLRLVWRDRDSILQHDNVQPHTSHQTQDALMQLKLLTLAYPEYSPGLAPSDYFLFAQLKKYLKGNHYDSDAESGVADVHRWCQGKSLEFFVDIGGPV